MPRFRLTIEYAGTRYSGWQIQKNAKTIAGEIDRAVRSVTGRKDFELYGSGRTDAGVHASGQVAHLDVSTSLPPHTLRRRVNDELPADINILDAASVPHRFHARHDAVARRYVYQIARRRTAFAKNYVWWVKDPLDLRRMREASHVLIGMRDFLSFAAADVDDSAGAPRAVGRTERPPTHGKAGSTLVLIDRLDIVETGDLVLIAIEGSHFLWKMVRRIVGVLAEVGRGGLTTDDVASFLRGPSSMPAKLTAPAAGLFLERVYYKGEVRGEPPQPITPLAHGMSGTRRPSTNFTTSA